MRAIFLAFVVLILISSNANAHTLYGNICVSEDCICNSNGLCRQEFPNGISILLTPKPNTGKYFVGWVGDTNCIRAEPCSIVMNQDKHVTALFGDIVMRRLHVRIKGTGNGKIGVVHDGNEKVIDITTPSGAYPDKSSVTLIPLPDSGSRFIKWETNIGKCIGTTNCKIAMTTDKIVVVIFEKRIVRP